MSRQGLLLALVVGSVLMLVSGCGSVPPPPSVAPTASPLSSAAAEEQRDARAYATCETDVIVSPEASGLHCGLYESSSAMVVLQDDTLLVNGDLHAVVRTYAQALTAHGWRLTKTSIDAQNDERWFTLATPIEQCLYVAGSEVLRPGYSAVDLSIVYDYVLTPSPCPM